ncbi:DUF1837 domain-containing protein [Flavobacterium sediminilitoris]|uniref:DUF1837 domain-containing protein n=1 Tax=Flavobacterium sediminilitoris TaxID=2024526 RepID=A0ABY4HJF0_9FLAO|nr:MULTISPECIES: Hachiman antiphage defense system protein HamA [Flavobacterium]UOX32377.1 DUF1837 domain-containing protein [Flavobacterium sediminilitoris]
MKIDWEKTIKIDSSWVDRQLMSHFKNKDFKITVRGYTPKVTGITFKPDDLIDELSYFLKDYVHSESSKKTELKSLKAKFGEESGSKRLDESLKDKALVFFGDKNPQTDGKYGELLLFALVESILKCKMVAHKIKSLSNSVDQVKGGDGIFLGYYETEDENFTNALLIGESKIEQGFSSAVDNAFESLSRFYNSEVQSEVNTMEFIVANENLFIDEDSTDIDFEEVFNRLTPGTDEFRDQVYVHPILIMYNTDRINTFEERATSKDKLEELIKDFMVNEEKKFIEKIKAKVDESDAMKKCFLDFFIFPFNNIDSFRDGMYYKIHKAPYRKKSE